MEAHVLLGIILGGWVKHVFVEKVLASCFLSLLTAQGQAGGTDRSQIRDADHAEGPPIND